MKKKQKTSMLTHKGNLSSCEQITEESFIQHRFEMQLQFMIYILKTSL